MTQTHLKTLSQREASVESASHPRRLQTEPEARSLCEYESDTMTNVYHGRHVCLTHLCLTSVTFMIYIPHFLLSTTLYELQF